MGEKGKHWQIACYGAIAVLAALVVILAGRLHQSGQLQDGRTDENGQNPPAEMDAIYEEVLLEEYLISEGFVLQQYGRQGDPRRASYFVVYDAASGRKAVVATCMVERPELVTIVDENHIILKDTGFLLDAEGRYFPVYLDCSRADHEADFEVTYKPILFDLPEVIKVGSPGSKCSLSDLRIEESQLELEFSALKDEESFHADYIDIPQVTIFYDEGRGALKLHFDEDVRIEESLLPDESALKGGSFITGCQMEKSGYGTDLYVTLDEAVTGYFGENVVEDEDTGLGDTPAFRLNFQKA